MNDLPDRVLRGEVRATARLISLIEHDNAVARSALAAIFPHTGRAYIVGVTGAPGSGKSTLVDGLVRHLRTLGQRVAVLAVDPSSPFSGGAILGDRIRMQGHAYDTDVFIRSMGARGHLGGLAAATHKALHVLDAAGYELIVVETVGVGQSELDIAGAADTTVVVATPGMGDTVQTMKAGILEIADIFALNKADQEGAAQLLRALRGMLHLGVAQPWSVPIVETQAHDGIGIPPLWDAVMAHHTYLTQSGSLERRRAGRLRAEVLALVERGLHTVVRGLTEHGQFATLLAEVTARHRNPDSAASEVLAALQAGTARIGESHACRAPSP